VHSAAVAAGGKSIRGEIIEVSSSTKRTSAKFLRLGYLRRLKECEKVAAVCYRIRPTGIQFLLVQTRGGRWTFPKGSVEPGLTHAQSAALEAFEEAGVHGRMQEAPFTHYLHQKQRNSLRQIKVSAHLCEVTRLEAPIESGRNRTWFSPENAAQRLQEGRKSHHGTELARVVQRALVQITRLQQLNAGSRREVRADRLLIEGNAGRTRSYAGLERKPEMTTPDP
jgi:8-oxo-dGTP pyrophosphatase MutT (NUDIX family)